MFQQQPIRFGTKTRATLLAMSVSVLSIAVSLPAAAQVSSYGDKQMGEVAVDHPSPLLEKVYVHQRLNEQIPLDGAFRDETGATVKLGDYFGKRPVILAIVYYSCPMLCSEELNGLVGSLEMVKFRPGRTSTLSPSASILPRARSLLPRRRRCT